MFRAIGENALIAKVSKSNFRFPSFLSFLPAFHFLFFILFVSLLQFTLPSTFPFRPLLLTRELPAEEAYPSALTPPVSQMIFDSCLDERGRRYNVALPRSDLDEPASCRVYLHLVRDCERIASQEAGLCKFSFKLLLRRISSSFQLGRR